MSPERQRKIQQIVALAMELSGAKREEILRRECGDDPSLRAEVEQLLKAAETVDVKGFLTDGDAFIDNSVGPYLIRERLGEGGMGVVYLAEQVQPIHRHVALKLIKLGMDTKQVIARFETEREALAMFNHPNVAKVLDAGSTESGRPYFVMEYVPGIPITDYCDKHRLTTKERLNLFIEVCHAVQHAHQKGIIHRDIKPSNVLVCIQDGKPVPKVIDFGVAKSTQGRLTERTMFTEQGQLIGTPGYMSPEQAEMTALDIDTRTDVYSLGVLLYELLVGERPFDNLVLRNAGLAEIQRIIREVDPPKPSTRLSSLGDQSTLVALKRGTDLRALVRVLRGDLDWIVMRCIEKDRTRRYDTASGLALEIQRYLAHEPVLAGPPSTAYRVRKFVRRNRGPVAAGALVIVVLVGGLAGTTYGLAQAVRAREAEARQRLIAEANEQKATQEAARARLAEQEQSRARQEAEIARAAEEKQRMLAEQREKETEQVAEFQASQLSGIDTALMGVRLRGEIIDKRRAALEARGSDQAAVESGVRELEASLGGVNFTNVALETLDENLFDRALTAIEKDFANQPLLKARLLQTVASTLRELGLLDRATSPQEEALRVRRKQLGSDHPDTLTSISNMGVLLNEQGKLVDAEPYYYEALEGRRRVLGDDHPNTLESINNMGVLLQAQGKLAEAEPYYREALVGHRRLLGDDHPNTLNSLHNIGALLQAQGKLAEAEPYYRVALDGLRRVLGDYHPDTLRSINNMGAMLNDLGKQTEAELYYLEALEGYRRVLGDDHAHTLTSISNMGFLLQRQGKLADAEPYYRGALDGNRRVLGNDHPNTLISIKNMGTLLADQGKQADAEPYYREAIVGCRRVLGDDHPSTLSSINNMGFLLQAQGRLSEAEPYYREALHGYRRVLGDDHPSALPSIINMGGLLQAQGKPAEAIDLLEPTEPVARGAFTGGNAYRLGRFLTALGRSRSATGAFDVAEANLTEAHLILSESKGATPKHREDVLTGLVELYDAWHEAEPGKGYDAKAGQWRRQLSEHKAGVESSAEQKPP